jgi:hypothetical protein
VVGSIQWASSSLRQQPLQLVEPLLGRVAGREARRVGELLRHRPEGAVGMIGRALVLQPGVRLVSQGVEQRSQDARLADPRLANQQHRLALPGPRLPPALKQQGKLLVAAIERVK